MKDNRINRFLALVLAVSMILSDASLAVHAIGEDLPVSCGLAEHTHMDDCYNAEGSVICPVAEHTHIAECYLVPETQNTKAEPESEEQNLAEVTENIEVAEAAAEPHNTESTEETMTADLSLMDRLMSSQTLQDLCAVMTAEAEGMKSLSMGEVSAVKTHSQTLYVAIETPTEDEQRYYDQIEMTLSFLLGESKPVQAAANLSNGGEIYADSEWTLSSDVTLENIITVMPNVTVTIDLNGYVLTVKDQLQLASVEGKLIITDSNKTKVHYGIQNDNGSWSYQDNNPGNANTTVYGGIITGKGKAENWGGAICVEPAGELVFLGGTISNFVGDYGGAIHSSGTFTMKGGTISGNTANFGGGISVRNSCTITGGTITGNIAYNDGGGVAVGGDQFTLNGGTISGNKANRDGGGIYSWKNEYAATDPKVSVISGEISQNTASWGGGIHAADGTLEISGGTISGNTGNSNGGGVCFKRTDVTMTGGTITQNSTSGKGGGIYIENGELTLRQGTISGNTAGNGAGVCVDDRFIMENGTISNNTATSNGGGIYNSGTATMNGNETSSGTISNNHSKYGMGGGIYNIGTFTMKYGTISGNRAGTTNSNDPIDGYPMYSSNWGGGVYTTGANFTMENGTITENVAASGGGVGVWGGSFDMKGGTISHNKAYGYEGTGNGGAAYVNGAEFNFYAGTIEHNWARRYGGAINLNEGGKLYLHGTLGECIIQNNSANNGGGVSQEQGQCQMAISHENIKIINNTAREDNREARDDLKADGCGGGLFIEKGTLTFSAGTISNNTAVAGGGVALRIQRIDGNIEVEMTGGIIADNTVKDSGGGIDIYASSHTGGGSNNVVVNLKGGSFRGNRSTGGTDDEGNPTGTGGGVDIWVAETNASAVMNIGAIGTNGPTLTNNSAVINGGAIRMRSGNVNLYSGTISGNSAGQYGGGITVNGGDFTMSGGTIGGNAEGTANTAGLGGGGIALRVVEFASDIDVTMTGGTILGNTAVNTGGGMDIFASCERTDGSKNKVTVELLGGTFEGNKTTAGTGGGIDIDVTEANSTAALYIGANNTDGPTFINNQAATNGGAIRMRSGSVFLRSGTITKNKATSNGGAFSINGGNFTMYDGDVSENQVTAGYGGGIALSNGTVLVSGGSIAKNTANVHGGGVVVSNGEVIMTGGQVTNNVAETGNGGGIYVTSAGGSDVAVKIFSGRISNNQAPSGSGGGLAVNGGQGNTKIFVQAGLNLKHTFTGDPAVLTPIPHDRNGQASVVDSAEFTHENCPVIENNSSLKSGGGILITGGSETNLNIYCLLEADNTTVEDADNTGVLSKFMMVEGGKVLISSSETGADGVIHENTSGFGNTSVLSSVHVYAGELYLYGSMENPAFTDALTVDYRNTTDRFEDNRTSNTVLKLSYNENFTDANGNPNSTLKAFDIKVGTAVTIAELLFNHPGYTIKAWNTDPQGKGSEFKVGDQYVFVKTEEDKLKNPLEPGQEYWMGDLNLYAVWEVNLFLVQYHHNIPEGEIYSGNMDGEHKFTYDQYTKLHANQFVYPGHIFQHWTYTKDDGTKATLNDEEEVKNLTNVRGGTVHLYATWVECGTDKNPHKLIYTATDHVLTCTCTVCHKTATVTILAENAVYDGNKHMYTVVYSDQNFLDPNITCTATKIGDGNTDSPTNMYVDAGNYTVATEVFTNADNTTAQASMTYTVEKATQRAPVAPTYTPPQGNGTVTIHQINDVYSPDSNEQVEYAVKYLDSQVNGKDNWVYSDWVKSDNKEDKTVTITVNQNLTNYHVLARYPGNDNYNPSPEVEAGESFFFHGKITVTILRTPGITHIATGKDSGLELELGLENGYYLTDGYYYVEVTSGDAQYITIDDHNNNTTDGYRNADGKFTITADKDTLPNTDVSIMLTIGKATKATTVKSKIAPNQVFTTVSDDETTISRDSAYTVYFEVMGYNNTVYLAPHLVFSQSVPANTKLILLNKADNTYWSYTVDSGTIDVPLSSFVRMGGAANDKFSPTGQDWKLQVIVDFSQAADLLPNETNLTTYLTMPQKNDEPTNAPDLSNPTINPGVTVALKETHFALEKTTDSGVKPILRYSFTGESVNTSKWDHRELALILRPQTGMPADAVINAVQNGVGADYRPVRIHTDKGAETVFLIPLNGFSGDVVLTLRSDTAKADQYSMSAQLVAAQSIAEDAPINGLVVASTDGITFSVKETPLSMKVTVDHDCHLFEAGGAMNLNIQIQPETLPAGYQLVIAQEQKRENDADYSFYGVYYEPTGTGSNRTLHVYAPANPGNYRIRFYIETANGTKVLETNYYFIVQ